MAGPGLFTDIGKKAKDLLTRDYSYDQKLSISTYSVAGVFILFGDQLAKGNQLVVADGR